MHALGAVGRHAAATEERKMEEEAWKVSMDEEEAEAGVHVRLPVPVTTSAGDKNVKPLTAITPLRARLPLSR